MELKGKKVAVVGLGESGYWASRLLVKLGAEVRALDQKPEAELELSFEPLKNLGIEIKTRGYELEDFLDRQLVVLSPGVDENQPLFQTLKSKGIEIIGELELASQLVSARVIAVSGTNGKTTTVSLLAEIFNQALPGKVWVGGNIGNPLSRMIVEERTPEITILEVSSFQLAQSKTFQPHLAVMLNFASDHLDRHKTLEEYYQAKLKLFENQTEKDGAVLNFDDPWVKKMAENIASQILWFSCEDKALPGAYLLRDMAIYQNSAYQLQLSLKNWKLKGKHNLENLLASICCAGWFKLPVEPIQEVIDRFQAPEHRLELAGTVNGVEYYNDSKATNPHSVYSAVLAFSQPIILLLGGRNKGNDFSSLAELLKSKAVQVICFGEAGSEIKAQLEACGINCLQAETMKDAVHLAYQKAEPGQVVVLSPGCASFDEFKNYKERGEEFKKLVKELK